MTERGTTDRKGCSLCILCSKSASYEPHVMVPYLYLHIYIYIFNNSGWERAAINLRVREHMEGSKRGVLGGPGDWKEKGESNVTKVEFKCMKTLKYINKFGFSVRKIELGSKRFRK